MTLQQLQIHNLRNLSSLRLDLHPSLNIIEGPNGSGKTSFLEALYLLGSGHSFRSREITPLITEGKDELTIFARTNDEQTISIRKSLSTPTQVRLNGQACHSSSELAHFLPCQAFYQDIFQIVDAGPTVRRSLLDWGLFHVKHHYHELWKDYRRALKQRNSLLKQKSSIKYFEPWDLILSDTAQQLDLLRKDYFEQLNKTFQAILPQLSELECSLTYYKGWDRRKTGKSLADILAESHQSDLLRQFTQYGAHQADLMVESNNLKIKHYLSRGQQKIILFALKLAQTQLLTKPCLFLADDIAAELDKVHLSRLITLLKTSKGQFFLTTIEQNNLLHSADLDSYKKIVLN